MSSLQYWHGSLVSISWYTSDTRHMCMARYDQYPYEHLLAQAYNLKFIQSHDHPDSTANVLYGYRTIPRISASSCTWGTGDIWTLSNIIYSRNNQDSMAQASWSCPKSLKEVKLMNPNQKIWRTKRWTKCFDESYTVNWCNAPTLGVVHQFAIYKGLRYLWKDDLN